MERKIYEKLRTHKRVKANNSKSQLRQELDTSDDQSKHFDYHDSSDENAQEKLTDFTQKEVEEMLIDDGVALEFFGLIGQGKEANVYWIMDADDELVAIKFFRIHTTSHNFNSLHTRSKLSDTAKLSIATDLCLQEFENLNYAYNAGVRVPIPKLRHELSYVMTFLGDGNGPAPLLRDVDLMQKLQDKELVIDVLDDILDQLDLLFNDAEMVHGDFSEHNIIWYQNQPWIIDFLQSERWHPRFNTAMRTRKRDVLPTLKKDIQAILDHFWKRYKVTYDLDTVFQAIAGDDIDDWSADQLMSEYADPDAIYNEFKRIRLD